MSRPELDADGRPIPPLTVPSPDDRREADEREPRVFLGLARGDFFVRYLGGQVKEARQVMIAVFWDEQLGILGCEPWDPAIHGEETDLAPEKIVTLEQLEVMLADEVEMVEAPVIPALGTARKRQASKPRIFVQVLTEKEAGGDPESLIPKPRESFRLWPLSLSEDYMGRRE